jgi:hypothetical protein
MLQTELKCHIAFKHHTIQEKCFVLYNMAAVRFVENSAIGDSALDKCDISPYRLYRNK